MKIFKFFIFVFVMIFIFGLVLYSVKHLQENKVLRDIISRLEADTRVAEVLVTGVNYDEVKKKTFTTIKFLEYSSTGKPLIPKYFTFSGNIIQFQALVIRFDDKYIHYGDKLKGKSAYLFWKVFMLEGANTQTYDITEMYRVPEGYKLENAKTEIEEKLWRNFWVYALDPEMAKDGGIKNAQIEAPGVIFIPGMLYTIKIEHDGGLRIDASPIPTIFKNEPSLGTPK
ncbi:hypothetical protein OMAG_000098 [Candidatus Omnitrophus magneticus]|uniref:Uncharacterized protein n=1 Tax=Candidatus Omnitrophus magneticus TaxID=1609969 RepID=A0A0F0CWS4_9BACT|nr:hypothetical protein OMAG_000098 [Candidatus Omnitrophus magneticus]